MQNAIRRLGAATVVTLARLGRMSGFGVRILTSAASPPWRFRLLADEMFKLGVLSVVVIAISGGAVGMVLGLQGYHTLTRFGAEESLGAVVGLSVIRELGPVLTALLTTGRAGSAATAEIGTMVATSQLDGLRMMSIDPIDYVVRPKAVALALGMPLLSVIFAAFALAGGYFVAVSLMGGDGGTYLSSLESAVTFEDEIVVMLIKALIFGVLVGWIATFRGYTSAPTSVGVSRATTSTVVTASVVILLVDYVITALWGV